MSIQKRGKSVVEHVATDHRYRGIHIERWHIAMDATMNVPMAGTYFQMQCVTGYYLSTLMYFHKRVHILLLISHFSKTNLLTRNILRMNYDNV